MNEVRESCYSRQGTRIYPGSAPLNRGKDLLPASLLLLWTSSRLQGSNSFNLGVGEFSLVSKVSLSLIKLGALDFSQDLSI